VKILDWQSIQSNPCWDDTHTYSCYFYELVGALAKGRNNYEKREQKLYKEATNTQ